MKRFLLVLPFFLLGIPGFSQWKIEKSIDEFTETPIVTIKLQAEKDPSTFFALKKLAGVSGGRVVTYANISLNSTKILGTNKVDIGIKLDSAPYVYEEWPSESGGKMIFSVPIYPDQYEKNRDALFSPKAMYGSSIDISPLLKAKTMEIKVASPSGVLKFKFNLAGLKEAIEKNPGFFDIPNSQE